MEIISYLSGSDGFIHYIFNNSLGVPFELWILLIGAGISFMFLVLKKMIG